MLACVCSPNFQEQQETCGIVACEGGYRMGLIFGQFDAFKGLLQIGQGLKDRRESYFEPWIYILSNYKDTWAGKDESSLYSEQGDWRRCSGQMRKEWNKGWHDMRSSSVWVWSERPEYCRGKKWPHETSVLRGLAIRGPVTANSCIILLLLMTSVGLKYLEANYKGNR